MRRLAHAFYLRHLHGVYQCGESLARSMSTSGNFGMCNDERNAGADYMDGVVYAPAHGFRGYRGRLTFCMRRSWHLDHACQRSRSFLATSLRPGRKHRGPWSLLPTSRNLSIAGIEKGERALQTRMHQSWAYTTHRCEEVLPLAQCGDVVGQRRLA